ncbi:glycosyltransferase [Pseudodesulfovibrio thermohalotolerans]|uniref:glycosyltransferase n=1 Tax=Pseudodesulfovibrio thermohalotolerans TaxID=2880651 RepID=UPI0024415D72|nr:glycosyltransferase [Pseudodesulfovibrio thermohalotolerans]WFS61588.1 glycosyltransferase [Pseudodesulfovibrio thermohalotolerans]
MLRVMEVIFTLSHGGAERLAMTILDGTRDRVEGMVCGVFGDGGPLEPALDEMGLRHVSLDALRRGKLGTWRELYRLFRQERVDIVHVQAGYLLLYAFIPARLAGAKVVYTEHAKHSIQTKPGVRRVIRLAAPFLSRITTVSNNLKAFFMDSLGQPEHRLEVIPNGVDTALFTAAGRSVRGSGIPDDGRLVFGSVARMTEAKDHGNLLRAFRRVRDGRDGVLLALVGDGETREEVERMIDELDLRDSVLMLGRRDDIPAWLRAMDVFVLPSRREGAPVSVLEAMACGVPVVATDVGGVSEILVDGENGRVVQPEDHEALAGAMLWMMDNPEARERFAEAGPKSVAGRYSNHAMCSSYLNLYEKVMS